MTSKFNLPLAIALAAALSASPALAQGKGKGNSRDNVRQEQIDRERDRDRDDDDDDDRPRFERRRSDDRVRDTRSVQQRSNVPPGWCRGRGNPHNTPQNCRYNSSRSAWERYDSRSGRWETRDGYERNESRYGTSGSYDQAHREFHASHDRTCRARAAQRPLDVRWQVQVRSECKAIHDDFHRRWGTAHR